MGVGVEGDDYPRIDVWWGGEWLAYSKNIHTPENIHLSEKKSKFEILNLKKNRPSLCIYKNIILTPTPSVGLFMQE